MKKLTLFVIKQVNLISRFARTSMQNETSRVKEIQSLFDQQRMQSAFTPYYRPVVLAGKLFIFMMFISLIALVVKISVWTEKFSLQT